MIYDNIDGVIDLMDSMGSRLTEARLKAGYTTRAAAVRRFGWPASTYAAHENGQNNFNPEQAEQYARAYGVRASWLLLADEDGRHIPSEEIAASLGGEDHYEAASRAVPYQGRIPGAIPEIGGKFGLGPGDAGEHQTIQLKQGATLMGHYVTAEWVFPSEYMKHTLRASQSSVFVVQVDGDSMMPVLMPGDRVLIDTSHTVINPDGLYAIDEGMGPQVKQVEMVRPIRKPAQVRIVSVNQSYTPSVVPLEAIIVVGRVCARITRM